MDLELGLLSGMAVSSWLNIKETLYMVKDMVRVRFTDLGQMRDIKSACGSMTSSMVWEKSKSIL